MDRNTTIDEDAVAPIFPTEPEVVYHILHFVSPEELIRLRTVSRQFRAIINDRILWTTVYADARLPRPPGPFSWQSTEFLQRSLVRSARLAQSWTSQPVKMLPSCSVPVRSNEESKFLCGRWLIVLKSDHIISHDINTRSEQVLCKGGPSYSVTWDATCCVVSDRGHLLYLAIRRTGNPICPEGEGWKLFEFQADDNSGHFTGPVIRNIPDHMVGVLSVKVESGHAPFVLISTRDPARVLAETVIFDTRSCTFYAFPALAAIYEPWLSHHFEEIVLTEWHIIVLCGSTSFLHSKKQLVQVYMLPDDKTQTLRLSYEGIIVCRDTTSWSLLRDSVTDTVTGSARLRLLRIYRYRSKRQFECVDLTLPPNSTKDVLPMSIDTHVVFAIAKVRCKWADKFINASPNGLVRGFCIVGPIPVGAAFRKFTIDATGERCVGVVGRPAPVEWPGYGLDYWSYSSLGFDGTSGRVRYNNWSFSSVSVVDFR